MTSRERVLAALDHREPDRVPIDFSGHRSSGVAAIVYPKLRECLGLPATTIRVYDPIQQLAIVDEDVLDRFGVDTIEMGRGFALDEASWADWTLPDGTPCKMPAWALPERRRGRLGISFARRAASSAGCPTARSSSSSATGRSSSTRTSTIWATPSPRACGRRCDRRPGSPGLTHRRPRGRGPAAAGADRPGDHRPVRRQPAGNRPVPVSQRQLPDAAGRRAGRAHAFLDKLVEHHLANLERFLGAVGPYIDIILFGDDLGMQTGPQMSPAMYREFFKPRHAAMWKRAKELARVKVMLHCCGGVRTLLPDLIEAGLDAINPVQISCRGMNAAGAEARVRQGPDVLGRRLRYPGNPPRRHARAGPRTHVREQVKILAPGGGFVFQQVHNIMANVPPENIIAMFDAVRANQAVNRNPGNPVYPYHRLSRSIPVLAVQDTHPADPIFMVSRALHALQLPVALMSGSV